MDSSDEFWNVHVAIRAKLEFDSNNTDEIESQNAKHDGPMNSTLPGILIN
jgi:hypothetical protein